MILVKTKQKAHAVKGKEKDALENPENIIKLLKIILVVEIVGLTLVRKAVAQKELKNLEERGKYSDKELEKRKARYEKELKAIDEEHGKRRTIIWPKIITLF